jgi:hypothetical protein
MNQVLSLNDTLDAHAALEVDLPRHATTSLQPGVEGTFM